MASIVPIIDQSGSMNLEGKFPAAQTDACTFINVMQTSDNLGVVAFSDNASKVFPTSGNTAVPITNQLTANTACNIIQGLRTINMTNIDAAITVAHGLLASSAGPRGMLLLSDGMWNAGNDPTKNPNVDIPVYTIGLGTTFNPGFLQTIATRTGGQYNYAPDAFQLAEIYNDIVSEANVAQTVANRNYQSPSYHFTMTPATVSASNEATFTVNWLNTSITYVAGTPGPNQLTVLLYAPGASTPFPATAATVGPGYVVFRVPSPTPGQWQVEVWNAVPAGVQTTVGVFDHATSAAMSLKLEAGDGCKSGTRMSARIGITLDGQPLRNTAFRAVLERPLRSLAQTMDLYRDQIAGTEPAAGVSADIGDPKLAKFLAFRAARLRFEDPHPRIFEHCTIDPSANGAAVAMKTPVPGEYTLRVYASGTDPRSRTPFTRTRRVSFVVH